jgi:hypothetical protein
VLSSPDSTPALEYQRTIVASVIELLDGLQARLPQRPAEFVWDGEAQRSYAAGLAHLRSELWQLRTVLSDARYRLGALSA